MTVQLPSPWKYNSYWNSQDIYKNWFTQDQVDAILAAITVLINDPTNPANESAWILKSGADPIPDGTPMGLLLSLTYTDDAGVTTSFTYKWKTKDGVIHSSPVV